MLCHVESALQLVVRQAFDEGIEPFIGLTRFACQIVPLCSRDRVGGDSHTTREDAGESVLGDGVASVGSEFEPSSRLTLVLRDASALEKANSIFDLCRHIPEARCGG